MYLVAPWADVMYFADASWCKKHKDGISKQWPWIQFHAEEVRLRYAAFEGQRVTVEGTGMMIDDPDIFIIHNAGLYPDPPEGLSMDPHYIMTGSNGGYQAINIALLAGADPILLVGYDMRYVDGRSHSHNGHEKQMPEDHYKRNYAPRFMEIKRALSSQAWQARGQRVINCTPHSAIQAFPRSALEEALDACV